MRRLFALSLLIVSASLSTGCATCCNPYDYAFGYHGGAWQRDNLCDGRVGSVFAPAGSQVYVNKKQAAKAESMEPDTLPSETKPEADLQPDDLSTSQPLKSVKRTRTAAPARPYLPVND